MAKSFVLEMNYSIEGKMLEMIQLILCTIYFIIFIAESDAENGTASCFKNESKTRIRVRKDTTVVKTIQFSNSEERKEEHLTGELPKVINPDFIQVKSLNSNSEIPITDINSTDKKLFIMNGEKSVEKVLPIVINSSINENQEKNIDSSAGKEQKETKELFIQKIPPKIKRRRQNDDDDDDDDESNEDSMKNGRAFLTAFENCHLMTSEHYLHVNENNTADAKKCVAAELEKLETYKGEYTKLLDNSGIIVRQ